MGECAWDRGGAYTLKPTRKLAAAVITPVTPADAKGMSMFSASAPDATLFSMVSVFVPSSCAYARPDPLVSTRALIWSWMACGMLPGIEMVAWMAALAGSPHGRTSAPMEKVTAGKPTEGVNDVASTRVTSGLVFVHVLVPPTPDSADSQEQPSASGRNGSMIPQTVLVDEPPAIMPKRDVMRRTECMVLQVGLVGWLSGANLYTANGSELDLYAGPG